MEVIKKMIPDGPLFIVGYQFFSNQLPTSNFIETAEYHPELL